MDRSPSPQVDANALAAPSTGGHDVAVVLGPHRIAEILGPEATSPVQAGSEGGDLTQKMEALLEAVERTFELVRAETGALRNHAAVNFADFNRRKSICALELNRAISMLGEGNGVSTPMRGQLLRALEELGFALEENREVLKMHVDAMRRVSGLISDMLQNLESDGTYVPPLAAMAR